MVSLSCIQTVHEVQTLVVVYTLKGKGIFTVAKRVVENRDFKWYNISRAGSNFSCNIFWFSTSTRVSATNKTEWRDKAQMLLKMVLQTRNT